MKKKIIISLVVLLVLGLSVFLLYKTVQEKQIIKDVYNTIPEFKISDLQGNIFTDKSVNNNKSTLFLFFDTECENCREEFEQIKKYRDSLPDCNMVFVSILPENNVLKFVREIDFQPTENMIFLIDTQAELLYKMDVKVMPTALIYNKECKLVKRYAGQVKVVTLIKYLSE
jgi:hypothetical protein